VTNDRQATDPDLYHYGNPAVCSVVGCHVHGYNPCRLHIGGVMTAKELLAKYLAGERSFIGEYLLNSNLSGSNLSGSNLGYSNLSGSDLSGSNLSGSNLGYSNLSGSDLRYSDLRGSNLRYSNLRYSNLRYSDLSGSDLRYSNLSGSDLSGSNLRGSDLSGSDLSGSNLRGSDLTNARLPHFQIVPEKGEYTAFKKLQDNLICELLVPATAKRTSSLIGRKCRASRAKVLSITSIDGKTSHKVGLSQHDGTEYKVGKFVTCKEKFNDDIRIECASGIHHFNNRKEAEEY
jgi:hypothetical protein